MAEKCKKLYIDAEGNKSRSWHEGAVGLLFLFANGEERAVEREQFPPNIRAAHEFHGMSQKLGDSYASAESVEAAVEAFDTRLEASLEGRWLDRTEGAVRTSDLAQAMHNLKPEKYPDVKAAQAAIATMTKEERKARESIPQVAAEIERLRFERAQAKVKAAQEAAAKAGGEALADL
jgi:hypothetical protein